ncbi:hypothetical protein L1N85_26375 [Paenibacillus alkaliterrae]|uniref:hypothetical protein n=1 Tax=Paenibacillus alkaliterrae TaxID=320909 RepID=UPI001F4122D3|nr:hypothetical protein [Paenibacillus alkaliterrae]MCF2941854.1 hypothetical protein [Paenibacillus alkaliterrae]
MKKRKVDLNMATQIAETPTLHGEDAEQVLKEITQVPSKEEMDKLREKLRQARYGILRRDRG